MCAQDMYGSPEVFHSDYIMQSNHALLARYGLSFLCFLFPERSAWGLDIHDYCQVEILHVRSNNLL